METLKDAKNFLRENWEDGVHCPCCNRYVKLYSYPFNSSMARLLIFIYKKYKLGEKEIHIESELIKNGIRSVQVQSKLVHWNLIKSVENNNPEKRMSGYYYITDLGINFIEEKVKIPKKVKYYNYKVYWKDDKLIGIREALGKKFNYNEMMNDNY